MILHFDPRIRARFRCKLLWVDGPADDHPDVVNGGGGGGGGGGKEGFVLVAMTNIGTMHCGLSRSPCCQPCGLQHQN